MSKRILLVDDNDKVRTGLKLLIEAHGYEVVEAIDGLDGLTQAKQSAFSCFVIDYKMPIMDGIALIKGLRQLDNYLVHPILLLTTDKSVTIDSKIANSDRVDILPKPVDKVRLMQLIATRIEHFNPTTA